MRVQESETETSVCPVEITTKTIDDVFSEIKVKARKEDETPVLIEARWGKYNVSFHASDCVNNSTVARIGYEPDLDGGVSEAVLRLNYNHMTYKALGNIKLAKEFGKDLGVIQFAVDKSGEGPNRNFNTHEKRYETGFFKCSYAVALHKELLDRIQSKIDSYLERVNALIREIEHKPREQIEPGEQVLLAYD